MRLRKKLAAVAVTTALAATLAACGGDDDSDSNDDSTPETSETTDDEPTEDETSDDADADDDESDDAGTAGELTEPGAELSIGDTATVPYDYAGNDGVIEVTVTAIESGTPADLEGVDGTEGMSSYYVQYDVTGVENAEGLSGMSFSLDGLDADDNPGAQVISFSGGTDGCPSESADSDWDGSTFSACTLVASETPITQAIFARGDDYSRFDGGQVTWS